MPQPLPSCRAPGLRILFALVLLGPPGCGSSGSDEGGGDGASGTDAGERAGEVTGGDSEATADGAVEPDAEPGPRAIVEADRSGHWLDRPFPSDELRRADGTVDWTILPEAPGALGGALAAGWAAQVSEAALGFSHQPAIYFRFEERFELSAGDAGLRSIEGGEDVPLEWWWVEDPAGDPYLAEDTLIVMPLPAAPLASGQRYVAWVSTSVASPAEGWTPPEGAPADAAVATAFTVQDSLGELRALADAVDAGLQADLELLEPTAWTEVTSLQYSQGQTPSGEPSTVATVTYADGGTDATYLAPSEGMPELTWTLGESWPFRVWEGRIQTLEFRDQAGIPWASPGIGLLTDTERLHEGWIGFVEGEPATGPVPKETRIVVQVPRAGTGPFPIMLWDHGTGGHAYNAIARANTGDLAAEVAAAMDGAVIVSRDQPLYGQHHPLIDEGFGSSLGFYNIGNLPCFRDNQRQAAADHRVLRRFATDVLPGLLDVDVDPTRLGAFGHSLGSVTLHGALVAEDPSETEGAPETQAAFMSGTGGYLTFYILETGLLTAGHSLVETIAPLLGFTAEALASATPAELIAALLELPEPSWPHMDRSHPVMQLFGTIMDPSDPLVFARDQLVPETLFLGVGDLQVPNPTTEWLGEVHPHATTIECTPTAPYDGHYCLFREQAGFDALEAFVDSL